MRNLNKSLDVKEKIRTRFAPVSDVLFYIAGSFVFALSAAVFTVPNDIAPGGVLGIATIINHLTGFPTGTAVLLLNIPLFAVGFLVIGKKYMYRSLFCLVLSSLFINLLPRFIPQYSGDPLLAALFGGLLCGAGLGMTFMRGGSTGGADIVARVAGKIRPGTTHGRMIMLFDFAVIASAAFIFGFERALYAVVSVYVSSKVIDAVLYGGSGGKVMFIISENHENIRQAVISEIERGATLLRGEGAYSGTQRDVLMCAVSRSEVYRVRDVVKKADPQAFIVITRADGILGLGFEPIGKNEFGEDI